jgi:hypothetical protein
MITSLFVLITTSRRLILLLIRRSLIRGGLVPPLILVRRTASNNIGPVNQRRRRVFGFRMGNPSMKRFSCGPKAHLHENARRYVVDIEVGYFEG